MIGYVYEVTLGATRGTWSEYRTGKSPGMRFLHSALPVDNSTMVILGGFSPILEPKRDVWSFKLDTKSSTPQGTWVLLNESGPYSYFGHGVVVLGRKIMLYGGTNDVSASGIITQSLRKHYFQSEVVVWEPVCEEILWSYDLAHNAWEEVKYENGTGPGPRCFTSAARLGGNMIVHGGCSRVKLRGDYFTKTWKYRCSVSASQEGVWSYHAGRNAWTRLSSSASLQNHLVPLQLERADSCAWRLNNSSL